MLDLETLVESAGDAIVAFMRDETERWNEERALRERIKALEAKGS